MNRLSSPIMIIRIISVQTICHNNLPKPNMEKDDNEDVKQQREKNNA